MGITMSKLHFHKHKLILISMGMNFSEKFLLTEITTAQAKRKKGGY